MYFQCRKMLSSIYLCFILLVRFSSAQFVHWKNISDNNSINFNTIIQDLPPLFYPKNFQYNEINNITRQNQCYNDIDALFNGIKNYELWALRILDSSGKLGSGVLTGNLKMLGQYDQCVTSRDLNDLRAQYCLATLKVNSVPRHRRQKEIAQIIDIMTSGRIVHEKIDEKLRLVPDLLPTLSEVQLGVCVPSSCSASEVEVLLNSALQNMEHSIGLEISAKLNHNSCSMLNNKPWNFEEIAFICFLTVLVSLGVFASIFGRFYPKSEFESTEVQILRAFSISDNWTRLMDTKVTGDFTMLNGIRVMTSMRIIIGHKILYLMQEPWINKNYILYSVQKVMSMPITNNIPSVDTFFMISGFLRCYNMLKELQLNTYDFLSSLWKRYLRLTPPMAVMLGFYMTLAPRLGSGPYWHKIVTAATSEVCRTNWIYNLLYLNNYMHHENGRCMLPTWYLATDMQLFILAPLLIYPAWKWPEKAMKIMFSALVVAVIFTFTYFLQTSSLPSYLPSGNNEQIVKYMNNVHFTTHHRLAQYIIGLIFGLIMFNIKNINISLSKIQVTLGWTISLSILYAIIFGTYNIMQYEYKYEVIEMSIYGALHRPAWAAAVAWIVFASHTGYGGWINEFFSARIFQPLSKISYCVFLTHNLVMKVNTGRIRTPIFMDHYELFRTFPGDLLITYVAATFLHIFVEAPSLQLIKIAFSMKKPKWLKES